MHKQRLATATPDPLAEFNGSASLQGRAVVERRDRPLPDCADSVQYRHIQSDLLSKCNPAVEHSASRHLPAISRQFQESRPISAVSVSFERMTSCFYHLHCTVFVGGYCSLFVARLSRYTSAYSLVCDIARNRVGTVIGR